MLFFPPFHPSLTLEKKCKEKDFTYVWITVWPHYYKLFLDQEHF